jgi:hypothetical protein
MSGVQALQHSAMTGQLILVAGAGISVALAGPSCPAKNWKQLIGSGLRAAQVKAAISDAQSDRWNQTLESDDIDDLLAAAEFVSAKLGGSEGILYSRWLAETFREATAAPGPLRDSFTNIARLGVSICTTNYDTLLEQVTGA